MRREWVYALTIFIGLWVDQNGTQWPIKGEYIVNIVCWLVFANIFAKGERIERIEMLTVIAFATPMELFFSEVWHLYEYREGLMPLFVPAGHWFLFDLGRRLCRRIQTNRSFLLVAPLLPLAIYFAWTGKDTSGLVFLAFVLGFIHFGPQPKLYAVMVWVALMMELWGTWLGNWAWFGDVPWTPLTMLNPPLLCGVFYALGDLLVNLAVKRFTQTPETGDLPTETASSETH
jgi:hypothetical protein